MATGKFVGMPLPRRGSIVHRRRSRHPYARETSVKSEPEFASVKTNGIQLRVALAGKGPLVVLVHGWPESWYSWRHQITALADAGYRVAAPDVRGYGGGDKRPQ